MIDRATLEAIAYRLKHAAGRYVDENNGSAAQACMDYADKLLDYVESSCDDKPITDAYNPATVAETWTDFEPVQDDENTTDGGSFSARVLLAADILRNECLADNQREDDYEPVYATLHFYYNDPDSMRRFRLCNQAEDLKLVLWEFDWWLRNKIKYNDSAIPEHGIPEDGIEWLQMARDQLWQRCNDYGIDLTED